MIPALCSNCYQFLVRSEYARFAGLLTALSYTLARILALLGYKSRTRRCGLSILPRRW
ncbi:hypothetical protein AGR7A_Lc120647 [Agrobacterium deltaense NCPPB 1641]|uniref:Uncharacterized protein n=1 Tax=Agrobacterium deltaense NCPPB 1641 TaxID=1183425 RepID=A0A1S7TZD8_9HYPH|nr:hypothetical protein AGR7A_Lc120647 [Agrobacterium deltaense NCPPB 1641]